MKKLIQFLLGWRDHRTFSYASMACSGGQSDASPKFLLLCGFLVYIIFLMLMQSKWLFSGEMYNEMAINYYHFSQSPDFLDKLFSLDAGYIPLPQRILALFGWGLKIPVKSISFFYTWSAIIFTAGLTLSFCSKRFRSVIVDDYLRLFIALSVLAVVDFETRTFINFSYFSVFFISIVTILAVVDTERDIPIWGWIIPVLMLSKPAVLCVVPFMLFATILSGAGSRFRYISMLSLFASFLQIGQLMISAKSGVMGYASNAADSGGLDRVLTVLKTFFSFLGAYMVGPDQFGGVYFSFCIGLILLMVIVFMVKAFRHPSVFLCICGVALVLSSVVLNVLALPKYFNSEVGLLSGGVPLYRHTIVSFWGVVFIVAGLCICLREKAGRFVGESITKKLSSVLFVSWFVLSGWFGYGATISREWISPFVNNSQWQNLSAAIQAGETPLCVPVDPFYFVYGNNCKLLSPNVIDFDFENKALERLDSGYGVNLVSPPSVSGANLVAVAMLVYPALNVSSRVSARLNVELSGGEIETLYSERVLDSTGGLIYFSAPPKVVYKGVKRISVVFDGLVEVAYSKSLKEPIVMWMGTDFLPEDFERALGNARAGDASAQFQLARYYELGKGASLNLGEAFNWYMKAAIQGSIDAQFKIGKAYRYGIGVQRNDAEAVKWFKLAAEQGSVNAQSEIDKFFK